MKYNPSKFEVTNIVLLTSRKSQVEAKPVQPTFRLVLTIGDERRLQSLVIQPRMVVGRGADTGEPQIDLSPFGASDLGVSRQHAALTWDGEAMFIEDLDSTNGTRINGKPIEPRTPIRVRNEDELEFGSLRVMVKVVRAPGK